MNKQDKYTDITLSSNVKYKDITALKFLPLRKVNLKKVKEAGKPRYWKWLGLVPLFKITQEKDMFVCQELFWDNREVDFNVLKDYLDRYHNKEYMIDNNDVYKKATVLEKHLNSKTVEYYFNTNEEAINKLNTIKKYCEECGNVLR